MDILPRSDGVLIDAIYATLVGEKTWPDLLDFFARDLPGGKAVLYFSDTSGNYRPFIISHGLDEFSLQKYSRYYSETNLTKLDCKNKIAGEEVMLSDEPISYTQFSPTERFEGFIQKFDTHSIIGVIIEREKCGLNSNCSFVFSLLTSCHNTDKNRPFALQLLRIAPHLQRVARAYRKGLFQKGVTEVSKSLLDSIGLIVCGDFGKIRFLSNSAQQIAANEDYFKIDRQHLQLLHQRAHQAFEWMLDRNYAGAQTMSFMHLNTRITLVRIPKDRYEIYFEGPTILILLEKSYSEEGVDLDCRYLVLAYGLSKAEARVLKGLLQGDSIACIAAFNCRSKETIRSQVKQIYSKTGAHSRVKLAQLAKESRLERCRRLEL